ncbi:MAG: hypothetical protein UT79_C0009G0001 [Candidatus Moranbacteria bacterium GW2011_GWC2_40_12]|nr:MAG: hypothetical protein UT79_C0009G0001 [Candidatus Moranbacteria bacterium GW2011_GWC2_40_12]
MRNKYIVLAVIAVVGLGVGFFGGMRYGQSKNSGLVIGQGQQRGQFGNSMMGSIRGANDMGLVSGDIISKDSTSLTIKLRDGGSKIVLLPGTVEISKFISGNTNDLEINKTVTITGKTNTDGSITAQTIQIRPVIPSPSPTLVK